MPAYSQTRVASTLSPNAFGDHQALEENRILEQATAILERRMKQKGAFMTNSDAVRQYLTTRTANYMREVFGIIWLTTRHEVIEIEELFFGSIDGAKIYPREVVRSALTVNASRAILYHNHPSGNPTPTDPDYAITNKLSNALKVIDVDILDHIITANGQSQSMADAGQL